MRRKGQTGRLVPSITALVVAIIVLVMGTIVIQSIVDTDASEDEKEYTIRSNLTDSVDFSFIADSTSCPLQVRVTNSDGLVTTPSFNCGTDIVTSNLTNITNGVNTVTLRYTL